MPAKKDYFKSMSAKIRYTFSAAIFAVAATTSAALAPGTDRIGAQRQDRLNATPAKAYRVDGSLIGRRKANYEVKVGR